ncbi:hypothetical protein ACWDR3_01395 [Streptomyces sp. NPDC001002]
MTTGLIADDRPLRRTGVRGPGDAGTGRIAGVVFDVPPGDPLL